MISGRCALSCAVDIKVRSRPSSTGGRRTPISRPRGPRRFCDGRIPWQVRVGETVNVKDYVAPPDTLSAEETSGEVVWSIGEYTPGSDSLEGVRTARHSSAGCRCLRQSALAIQREDRKRVGHIRIADTPACHVDDAGRNRRSESESISAEVQLRPRYGRTFFCDTGFPGTRSRVERGSLIETDLDALNMSF